MAFLNKKRPESLTATPAIFLDKRWSQFKASLLCVNYNRIAGFINTNCQEGLTT
jgi:hypothetical protein